MWAFVALPLPDTFRNDLLRVQASLPSNRPVPEDNLHLTLAFLDDCSLDLLSDLHEALESLVCSAPDLQPTGISVMPATRQTLVVVDIAPSESLTALQRKVAQAARSAGIVLPRRRFRPHITLTRGRAPARLPTGLRLDIATVQAAQMALYTSYLGPDGARHEILHAYPLVPSPCP